MAALADRWAVAAEIEKILDDPAHPLWMAAGKLVIEHAYGAPGRRVEVASDIDIDNPTTVRIIREG